MLPWYVTGQLETADRLLVDAHLATCAVCREDLAAERRLAVAVRDLPHEASHHWERLAATLPPGSRHVRWWRQPVRLAWFVAAQAAVLLLCIGLLTSRTAPPNQVIYHTLGDGPARRTGNVLIMFKPETSRPAIEQAVAQTGGRLIEGPTAAGAYLLDIAPGKRDAALASLRRRADVTLAQPLDVHTP